MTILDGPECFYLRSKSTRFSESYYVAQVSFNKDTNTISKALCLMIANAGLFSKK